MKRQLLAFIPMALLASCSSELVEGVANNAAKGGVVDKVTIKTRVFEYDDDTRTSLTATEQGISFAWANGDALGVFPVEPTTNNQARQDIKVNTQSCDDDAHYATFDGAGWALDSGNSYAAYSPYNGQMASSTPYSAVPVNMDGQDGTLSTIGKKYDFMYAPSSFYEENSASGKVHEVVFDFSHAVSIIQLKLTMPVADTWTSLTLSNLDDKAVWVTSATINVANGSVSNGVKASSISLSLTNVKTTEQDKELTLYVAALPTETEALKLTVTSADGTEYVAGLDGKTLVAGKAYRWIASPILVFTGDGEENGHAYVDLDLPSRLKWAMTNVGATVPHEYGDYIAWGETASQEDKDYDWDSYSLCNGTQRSQKKYCLDSSFGKVDNKDELEDVDDAACVRWKVSWRMPERKDVQELFDNCFFVWTANYNFTGTAGCIVYKAKEELHKGMMTTTAQATMYDYSLADAHLFLPAAGFYSGGSRVGNLSDCYFWTASLCESDSGWTFHFNQNKKEMSESDRCYGQSIRPVLDE